MRAWKIAGRFGSAAVVTGRPCSACFGDWRPHVRTLDANISACRSGWPWPLDTRRHSERCGATRWDTRIRPHVAAIRCAVYQEGSKVGYKWFDAEDKVPLFPFGHGLSYTTFSYSGLKVMPGKETQVTFTVKNAGSRAGVEIAQVYVALPAGTQEPPKRLVGWEPVQLKPGESKTVTVTVPGLYVSIFDVAKDDWQVAPGEYKFMVGGSSRNLPLSSATKL